MTYSGGHAGFLASHIRRLLNLLLLSHESFNELRL
jgi:hypothetical protein